MAVFAYKALDTQHRVVSGTLAADTPAEARRQLRGLGLCVDQLRPARSPAPRAAQSRRFGWLRSGHRRREAVAELSRHLAILLRAGAPLTAGLDVLIRQRSGALEIVLRQVRERIAAGSTFANALGDHPVWFDALFISAVRVGELSGALDEALSELARFLRNRQSLHARLTGALIYPMVLTVLGIGVVIFLMTFVMPQLLSVLIASGKSLPASTVLLKRLSDVLIHQGWIMGLAVFAAALAGSLLLRTVAGRRGWHRLQLRLPLAGVLIAKVTVAQFAQMMLLLLKAGVPFVEALEVTARSVRNQVLADELATVRTAVEAGSDIASALQHSRIFPPLVVHVVGVGQESGELIAMLAELKSGYETEVELALGKFTAALEPMLIVVLAALVGFVIFATMMPILEAAQVAG